MQRLAITFLLASILALYLYRYQTTKPIYKAGDRLKITSKISQDPKIDGFQQILTLEGLKVYTDRFPAYSYGDTLTVEGTVPKGNYNHYLKDPKIKSIANQGYFLSLREKLLAVYAKNLPEPHNGLLSGIVLGTKNSLENEFLEKLRNTGTLHIVVASGTNIAIFTAGLLYFLVNVLKTHRRLAILISFIIIWVYVFFIGFQAPIVRAGLMASIVFLAQALGREGDALRALLISGTAMLLIVPSWLFDLGFQLSFLATLGIILLTPKINKALQALPSLIGENLATTLGAQIAVFPLIIYKFGNFPLISPLVNILVVPLVPIIMTGGFILGLTGLLMPALASYLAWLVFLPLEYFVRVINLFSQ